jgi:uncharacterized protein (TIGR02145 family)
MLYKFRFIQKLKLFWSSFKIWFKERAKSEITLFSKSKYSLSFKPFLFCQGLAVFAVIIISFAVIGNVMHTSKINALAIKSVITKQNTTIVANGNPIQWTALVKRSDIKSNQYLLKLPKTAKNIKVQAVSVKQAKNILAEKPKELLSLNDRVAIATKSSKDNKFLAKVSSFLFANLSDAVDNIAETITDTTVVDLSSEMPTQQEVESSTPVDLTEDIQVDEQQPAPESEEAPVAPPEENAPATGTADIVEPEAAFDEPTAASATEGFGGPTEDVVKIDYETPAPTIAEENTDTGKLVTVSSTNVECKRTPTKQNNVVSKTANKLFASLETAVTPVVDFVIKKDEKDDKKNDKQDVIQTEPITETPTEEVVEAPPVVESVYINEAEDTAYQECLSEQVQLTDVLASTKIPEIYKVGEEDKIHIKWKNNGGQNMVFKAYDTNNNSKLDYVEWTIPHLSEQIFEIIFISKAFQLDSDKNIVADIYDKVQTQDGNYATVPVNNSIRVTFQTFLDETKDITIYAKPADVGLPLSSIKVYPVYDDGQGNLTEGPRVADFPTIDHEGTYKILLTNLQTPTDLFDLKIVSTELTGSSDISFDYIVDPTPATVTDNFDDSTKIATSTNITVASGVVTLSSASSWTCGSSLVDARDGKSYNTVLIGAQCWMAQNLNVGVLTPSCTTGYAGDGWLDACTNHAGVVQNQTGYTGTTCGPATGAGAIQKYCYAGTETNCNRNTTTKTDGALYQWAQAMCGSTTAGVQGICPTGWHLPTDAEYITLEEYLGMCTGVAGSPPPYCSGDSGQWRGTTQGTNLKTVDSTHFSGLLAGGRGTDGSFFSLTSSARFWSSLQSSSTGAFFRGLNSGYATVLRDASSKTYGFSVRCLKNR